MLGDESEVGGELGLQERQLVLLAKQPDGIVGEGQEGPVRHLRAGRPPEHDGEREAREERHHREGDRRQGAVETVYEDDQRVGAALAYERHESHGTSPW